MPAQGLKLMFIDLETTGLDPKVNCPIEFGGLLDIDGKEVHRESVFFQPLEDDPLTVEKLKMLDEVTGLSEEQIRNFQPSVHGKKHIERFFGKYVNKYDKTDKYHFVGYNAKFDWDMLREWWIRHGDKYYGSWFWFPYFDVMTLAGMKLAARRHSMSNFKLSTVARELGIEVDEEELHGAMYDIELTRKVFNILVGRA